MNKYMRNMFILRNPLTEVLSGTRDRTGSRHGKCGQANEEEIPVYVWIIWQETDIHLTSTMWQVHHITCFTSSELNQRCQQCGLPFIRKKRKTEDGSVTCHWLYHSRMPGLGFIASYLFLKFMIYNSVQIPGFGSPHTPQGLSHIVQSP